MSGTLAEFYISESLIAQVRRELNIAMWEAQFNRVPHCIFNHPLFPGQGFILYYPHL